MLKNILKAATINTVALLSVAVQSPTGPSLIGERHMEASTNTVHTFSRTQLASDL